MSVLTDLVTNQKALIQSFENESAILDSKVKEAENLLNEKIENAENLLNEKIEKLPDNSIIQIAKENPRPYMFIMGKHSNYWNNWLSTARNWWDDGRKYLDALVRDSDGYGIRWEEKPDIISGSFRIGFQSYQDGYNGAGSEDGVGYIGTMFISNPTKSNKSFTLGFYHSARGSGWASTAVWALIPDKTDALLQDGKKISSISSTRLFLRTANGVWDNNFSVSVPAGKTIALVWKVASFYWTSWNGLWTVLNMRWDDLRPIYNAGCKIDVERTFKAYFGLNDQTSINAIWEK